MPLVVIVRSLSAVLLLDGSNARAKTLRSVSVAVKPPLEDLEPESRCRRRAPELTKAVVGMQAAKHDSCFSNTQ
jgi:hypothetical protein